MWTVLSVRLVRDRGRVRVTKGFSDALHDYQPMTKWSGPHSSVDGGTAGVWTR